MVDNWAFAIVPFGMAMPITSETLKSASKPVGEDEGLRMGKKMGKAMK
jgi:hypothetical protein